MSKHHWNVYKPYLKALIDREPLTQELSDGLVKEAWAKVPQLLKLHFVLEENGFSDDEIDSLIRPKFNISSTHLGFLAGFMLATASRISIEKNRSHGKPTQEECDEAVRKAAGPPSEGQA